MSPTLVRCCCCGMWLLVFAWDRRKPTYCDSCDSEGDPAWRTGPGRGQCMACKTYPQSLEHWKDPKPTNVPVIYICKRYYCPLLYNSLSPQSGQRKE